MLNKSQVYTVCIIYRLKGYPPQVQFPINTYYKDIVFIITISRPLPLRAALFFILPYNWEILNQHTEKIGRRKMKF